MRSASLALAVILFSACDSQEIPTPAPGPLVATWVLDSIGTAESITPAFSGSRVNFGARPTGGEAVLSGGYSTVLRYASVLRADPSGYTDSRFASYDMSVGGPTTFPSYAMGIQSTPSSSSFSLYVRLNRKSTGLIYTGTLDGPPRLFQGDQVVLPSVTLYGDGGRPSVTLERGEFSFPTVDLVAGRPFLFRREVHEYPNPAEPADDFRYALNADGTYQLQSYVSPVILSVREEGEWRAVERELTLQLGHTSQGVIKRFLYEVSDARLTLLENEPVCQGAHAGPMCLDEAGFYLGLPPGSVSAYERKTVRTFHK